MLEGVPKEALQYKFNSKCALEWILEFYKEPKNVISGKSCDDPSVREEFNTYKFADHKEHVIDLLQRVNTVSVETMRLRRDLERMPWGKQSESYLGKSDASIGKTEKKPQARKSKHPKKQKSQKRTEGNPGSRTPLTDLGRNGCLGTSPRPSHIQLPKSTLQTPNLIPC